MPRSSPLVPVLLPLLACVLWSPSTLGQRVQNETVLFSMDQTQCLQGGPFLDSGTGGAPLGHIVMNASSPTALCRELGNGIANNGNTHDAWRPGTLAYTSDTFRNFPAGVQTTAVEIWFTVDSLSTGTGQPAVFIITKPGPFSSNDVDMRMVLRQNNGDLAFSWRRGGGGARTVSLAIPVPTNGSARPAPIHAVFNVRTVFQPTGPTSTTLQLGYSVHPYLNGQFNASKSTTVTPGPPAFWNANSSLHFFSEDELAFGIPRSAQAWRGTIHHFAIYRRNLTAEEIVRNYQAGLPNALPIARNATATVQENGEVGTHYDTPEFYLSPVPVDQLATLDLLAADPDEDPDSPNYKPTNPPTAIRLASLPATGTLYFLNGTEISAAMLPAAVPREAATGQHTLRFRPAWREASAPDVYTSFTFQAIDGVTGLSSAAVGVVSIVVTPVHRMPEASPNTTVDVVAGEPVIVELGGTASNGTSITTIYITGVPAQGDLYQVDPATGKPAFNEPPITINSSSSNSSNATTTAAPSASTLLTPTSAPTAVPSASGATNTPTLAAITSPSGSSAAATSNNSSSSSSSSGGGGGDGGSNDSAGAVNGVALWGTSVAYVYTGPQNSTIAPNNTLATDSFTFVVQDDRDAISLPTSTTIIVRHALAAMASVVSTSSSSSGGSTSAQEDGDSSIPTILQGASTAVTLFARDDLDPPRTLCFQFTALPQHGTLWRPQSPNPAIKPTAIQGPDDPVVGEPTTGGAYTSTATVYYQPRAGFFNLPATTWRGDAFNASLFSSSPSSSSSPLSSVGGAAAEGFAFRAYVCDAPEVAASPPIQQPLQVCNVNDPLSIEAPASSFSVLSLGSLLVSTGDAATAAASAATAEAPSDLLVVTGWSLLDPDMDADPVVVNFTARHGILRLNPAHLFLADFVSTRYCHAEGASWECRGSGEDRSMVFVTSPSNLWLLLEGMEYQCTTSNVQDVVTLTVYDGQREAEAQPDALCLPATAFNTTSDRSAGCLVTTTSFAVTVGPSALLPQVNAGRGGPPLSLWLALGGVVLFALLLRGTKVWRWQQAKRVRVESLAADTASGGT